MVQTPFLGRWWKKVVIHFGMKISNLCLMSLLYKTRFILRSWAKAEPFSERRYGYHCSPPYTCADLLHMPCTALILHISSCVGIVGVRRNQSRRCCTQWTHQPKVPFDWLTQRKDTHRAKLDKGLRHEILKNYELQVISSLNWPFQLLQLTTEDYMRKWEEKKREILEFNWLFWYFNL